MPVGGVGYFGRGAAKAFFPGRWGEQAVVVRNKAPNMGGVRRRAP
jgi:hypothetical protein